MILRTALYVELLPHSAVEGPTDRPPAAAKERKTTVDHATHGAPHQPWTAPRTRALSNLESPFDRNSRKSARRTTSKRGHNPSCCVPGRGSIRIFSRAASISLVFGPCHRNLCILAPPPPPLPRSARIDTGGTKYARNTPMCLCLARGPDPCMLLFTCLARHAARNA